MASLGGKPNYKYHEISAFINNVRMMINGRERKKGFVSWVGLTLFYVAWMWSKWFDDSFMDYFKYCTVK